MAYRAPMQPPYSPTARRRRLSTELKRMREEVGWTLAGTAQEVGWTLNKLQRTESGERQKVPAADLDALMGVYRVSDESIREAMHELARDAKQRGWWSRYRDVFRGSLPDYETEAAVIKTFEALVIPGLLQVPDYTEAIFRGSRVHEDTEVMRYIEARMERQRILNRVTPPRYHAVIDEATLRRPVGGYKVMREQVHHLVNMAARHNIDIQVLPYSAGAHSAMLTPFVIMEFTNILDPDIVFTETHTASLIAEDKSEVDRYNLIFSHAQGSALSPSRSVGFLEEVAASLESDQRE